MKFIFVDFTSKGGKTPTKKQTKSPAKSPAKSPGKKQDGGQTKLSFASPTKPSTSSSSKTQQDTDDTLSAGATSSSSNGDISSRDNSFRQFRRLCEDLENEPSYNAKTKLVATYLKHGNSGSKHSTEGNI